MEKLSIFWFRRDLRLEDNTALYHALKGEHPVMPIFIFDSDILDSLPKDDARLSFIWVELQKMRKTLLEKFGSSIAMFQGKPKEVFQKIISEYSVNKVYTNRDYEPYALERDASIKSILFENGIEFQDFKDQVIFEKSEVEKNSGGPYLVFTPYMKQWKKNFENIQLKAFTSEKKLQNTYQHSNLPNLNLADIGFEKSCIEVPPYSIEEEKLNNYSKTRDIPSMEGTTQLSPHLRFGTVPYRKLVKKAIEATDDTFLSELIWREFYKAILIHFPATVNQSFKPAYDRIKWRNNEAEFDKWKEGKTGYPIVDAGMRQLNEIGWMHNRVRMIVGSFLCKHLLIDWRWGEAYFAEKLLDYDMASNLGGWQWVAGTGVDAAPYFRIFNPYTQTEKFDKDEKYIKKWVKEYRSLSYPDPIVEHKMARERCLAAYKEALK